MISAVVLLILGVAQAPEVILLAAAAQTAAADDPDRLYDQREDLASATRAADLWAARATTDFDASWKLSRICYWIGTHAPAAARRSALERGVTAGERAIRLAAGRPEGHFWLAANMGALAESFGVMPGIKYRGRIKTELERVLAIDASWQGGSADAALGQWYLEVPRLLGGSREKAEAHLRQALAYDPYNRAALSFLADLLAGSGRSGEAQALLHRVLEPSNDPEWMPEDNDFRKKAAERLNTFNR